MDGGFVPFTCMLESQDCGLIGVVLFCSVKITNSAMDSQVCVGRGSLWRISMTQKSPKSVAKWWACSECSMVSVPT